MKWPLPPKIKVPEALGCIADKRIEIDSNNAKVYSSSKGKFYTVAYNPDKNSIMANDNGSYWVGYLGYPSIAFLMSIGVIHYEKRFAEAFKDIKWKDINVKFKNDYAKTEAFVLKVAQDKGFSIVELNNEIDNIYNQMKNLGLEKMDKKILPPKGY